MALSMLKYGIYKSLRVKKKHFMLLENGLKGRKSEGANEAM